MDATKWKTAARRRNCSFDDVIPINRYMCVPNQEMTEFLEFCYDEIRPMVQPGKYLYECSIVRTPSSRNNN